jgi:hypothetical protein
MAEEIWIPDSPPDRITIYVDETYFDKGSGLIQVGLPVPDSGDSEFKKAVDLMRAEFPRFQHTEFKAGKLDEKNAPVYTRFLKLVINLTGIIGDQSYLRAVVTVEAAERSEGDEHKLLLRSVEEAFSTLHIESAVGPEFARQIGWLRRNLDHLCRSPIQNPFRVLVDEKYRDAAECQSLKPALSPTLGIGLWWEHWKHLTSMLNVALGRARRKTWMPNFTEFRFEKDKNSIYLQAADLLSNLFYNGLKFDKGIRSEKTPLKNDVLRTVYDSPFEPRLLDALEVVTRIDKTGKAYDLLILKDSTFSGRMTLKPYTQGNGT